MCSFLRSANWLPRPLVKWVRDRYLAVLDLNDWVRGRTNDLVPPRSQHFIGWEDFREIGKGFFRHFVDVCDLRPDETILDIGCGTGRMAIPLLEYIKGAGAYLGFDISEKAIRWCQDHITSLNPCFTFVFADIWNKEYNPRGKIAARDYSFPCKTASIDFAFATSVFTHMRLPDVQHYLVELHRSLKPSGRAMLTFFIMDETNQRLVQDGEASARFSIKLENCYTIDRRTPERAIAYTEVTIRNLFAEAGLRIKEPIRWGSWSGRANMLTFQDVVIATTM